MSLSAPVALLAAVMTGTAPTAPAKGGAGAEATPLSFQELLEPSPRELVPTAKLLSLQGKRVRLVGYMARMESPPKGAFYLAPHPVSCDEAGGGTADLPPDAVRVVVRSAAGQVIPWVPRALEVTGTLELGPLADEEGRVSSVHLVLDRRQDLPRSLRKPASQTSKKELP
jgi:hypothetical protein